MTKVRDFGQLEKKNEKKTKQKKTRKQKKRKNHFELSGSDAARALGQASLSPMLKGSGSIPVRNVGFSPLNNYVLLISGQAVGGFLRALRFSPPPSGTFKIKIRVQIM